MKLATSTNIVCDRPDGSVFDLEKTLKIASDAGFKRFDISFYDWALPHSPFLTDKWESWIYGVANSASKLGVEFGQSHAYTFQFLKSNQSEEEFKYHQGLVERSLICCHILGSRISVTHPDTDRSGACIFKDSKEKNIEYFTKLLEFADKLGMSLAIENMCDVSSYPIRKYCNNAEELVDLVSAVNDERLGICWDFEHADIMKQDQAAALRLIGKYLMATHVSDTHSSTDDTLMHVMPLFGTVNWHEVMPVLTEIGYTGDFSFEAHNYANRLPDKLLPTAVKLAYEIGEYLMELAH